MTTSSLRELYQRTSKHSNYQVLPAALSGLLSADDITVKSRHEQARLDYMLSRLSFVDLQLADIGGNTGFFSFELLRHGAAQVDYFEGNAAHHDFVQAAARELGLAEQLRTHARYVSFAAGELPRCDATLLLNVLHHLGDDFGDTGLAMQAAKQQMLGCLATLSRSSRLLVFQLGFNWQGDPKRPLFAAGTKTEMIEFIKQGTAADWSIEAIGIAEQDPGRVVFRDLSAQNIARQDALGEFLNRPIFIMRSRHLPPAAARDSSLL